MWKKIVIAILILVLGAGIGFFVYKSQVDYQRLAPDTEPTGLAKFYFKLGLDLSGGSHLVYNADISQVPTEQIKDSMSALRDVIERRINIFGVSEPIVQVQHGSVISGAGEQLVVDLPGVTDVKKAIEMIGQTPLLEFKIEAPKENAEQTIKVGKDGKAELDTIDLTPEYVPTELTGRYLKKATLEFDPTTREPKVSLQFDDTGTKLFAEITKNNIGKIVAIYLDGAPISTPVVREEIPNGQAVISGNFTPTEAKQLVGRLNSGALPVPITLLSTQTIGATLGESAVKAGVMSAIVGFILIALFLILLYRLPGFIATVSLSLFIVIILSLFKLIPVTLTAAGIAGFIISIGIAVDANVLIFERMKEELRSGKTIGDAVSAGFSRAWSSIRDSNISSFIGAIILYWFGTSLIKGFALTLGIGIIVSMLSAITVTRIFLSSLSFLGESRLVRFLFSSGLSSGASQEK